MLVQKTRYAIRALMHLASASNDRSPVSLSAIAETQRLPFKYLEQIMLDLKRAGFVTGVRGPRGGYRLARAAEAISFGEIIRAMEGPIALLPCASVNFYAPCGDCQDEELCAIRRTFMQVRDQSAALLEGVTLASAVKLESRDEPSETS